MDRYAQIIERISSSSGISSDELDRRIEAKRAKLSGLISKEGAAQIVAAELGVSFDNQRISLAELAEGMKRARVIGKITKVLPIRTYEKNGKSGKIGSFFIGDQTSNVRVVLWDTNHIQLIEDASFKEGDVVELTNASVRNGELQLSAFSDLKKSTEQIGEVKQSRSFAPGTLKDARPGMSMRVRATIVQLFDPKYFDGKDGQKRLLVNAVIDDGTETIRSLLGPEQLMALGFDKDQLYTPERFGEVKEQLLGEEKLFTGNFRTNSYFNKTEFSISGIEPVDVNALLQQLESSA